MTTPLPPSVRPLAALALALACAPSACDSGASATPSPFPDVGDSYPAATVRACDGASVSLSDWIAAHDVVYIGFGAKWCQACQEEAPVLNAELVDGLAGKSVGVAQILVEDDPGLAPPQSLCAAWHDDLSARYDVFVDVDQESLEPHFGGAIANLPLHYIVTKDGTIRLRKLGALPDDIKQLVSDWLP